MSDNIFTGHVVQSVSVENLVRQRNAVVERLTSAMQLIWEAQAIARKANIGFPYIVHKAQGTDYDVLKRKYRPMVDHEEDSPIDKEGVLQRIIRSVDSGAWAYLMHQSGLRTFMDSETRREWDEKVYNDDVPELDKETIEATFEAMYLNRRGMLEDGVVKCFKRLSWCYRTNQPFRFGKRIILSGFGRYNYRRCDELDDLMRVFHVLDGKPEPDHRNGMFAVISAVYRETHSWPKICENEYLHIKIFKNSNAHVTFKRADVVDKMNEMVARRYPGALPHDRRAA